jgi:hypothetical protein
MTQLRVPSAAVAAVVVDTPAQINVVIGADGLLDRVSLTVDCSLRQAGTDQRPTFRLRGDEAVTARATLRVASD